MSPVALLAMLAAAAAGLTPVEVVADVRLRGAETVRSELYNDEDRWQQVIRGVQSGLPAWLEVAQRLKDLRGDASEELTIAVSRALARSPRTVLAILDGNAFDADDVCSLNTLENSLGDDYVTALREVERRQKAVAAVKDPKVAVKKRECLAFLRELEDALSTNRTDWFGQ